MVGALNGSKGSAVEYAGIRVVETDLVKDVEKLRAELEPKPLIERDVFQDGEVRAV